MSIVPRQADKDGNRGLQQQVASVLLTFLDYDLPGVYWTLYDNQRDNVKCNLPWVQGQISDVRREAEECAAALAQWAEFLNVEIQRREVRPKDEYATWFIETTFNGVKVRIYTPIGLEHDARCFPEEAAAEAAERARVAAAKMQAERALTDRIRAESGLPSEADIERLAAAEEDRIAAGAAS